MNRSFKKTGRLAALLLFFLLSLTGCQSSTEPLQMNGMYFDTIVNIRIWGAEDDSVFKNVKHFASTMKTCSVAPSKPAMFPASIRQTGNL